MARSVSRRRVEETRYGVKYIWPDAQMNFWIILMLATGGVLIGINAAFVVDQNTLGLGIPWIMPFGIAVGSLTVIFLIFKILIIINLNLLPGFVIIGCFVLGVLYITGLIETAIQVFGPQGNINGNCQLYVYGHPASGVSVNTLAWLEQNSVCQSWIALFAFWIVGTVLLVYMLTLSWVVSNSFRTNYRD